MNLEEKLVLKERLLIFVRGILMGMADIVPGVSGGTIALITGIYERLIFAIKGINLRFLAYLLRKDVENAKKHLFSMDLGFLITLGLGIMAAFMVLSRVIGYLMQFYPANTYAFFFGLILASAGFVYRQVSGINHRTVISAAFGFALAFAFVGAGTLQTVHTLPVIFASGVVAVCAMILPGISGAFILFFLGQYEYMLGALHGLDLLVVLVFMVGALTGLFSMARLLGYLLHNHKPVTMAFLVGLMLGALRMPYDNIVSNSYFLPLVLAFGVAGFLAVVILEKLAERIDVERPSVSLP
jgi:putative membrane protein